MPSNGSLEIITEPVEVLACSKCGTKFKVSQFEPFTKIRCPQCKEEMLVPARLGQFLLMKELGRGAMGAVYKGYDSTLKRIVAIKVMQRKLGDDQAFAEKFLGEARALAALNHPNVVQIYSCGKEKGQLYIVMEYVNGGRVDLLMKEKGGSLPEDLALTIMMDVARGMKAAAKIGLVHGDIKAENMLRDQEENTKVVDFGLARFAGDKPKEGEIWGTPFYIAPEVLHGRMPNQQSDIYSLGATLFHILGGQPPFNGKTAKEVVIARLKAPAPDLQTIKPDIHPVTANLVARMLEMDPFKRYPNYDSLLADIDEALETVKGPSTRERKHGKKKKSNIPVFIGLAALIAAIIGAGIWLAIPHRKKPQKTGLKSGTVTRLVNGKLVEVSVADRAKKTKAPSGTSTKASHEGPVTTAQGKGADTYIRGAKRRDSADENFGDEDFIWVKAGKGIKLHLARKGYLKFDLSGLPKGAIKTAELRLMYSGGGKNGSSGEYTLRLWGLNRPQDWQEKQGASAMSGGALTWDNAPGNNTESASSMSSDTVLLAEIDVPPNPEVGQPITFNNTDSLSSDAIIDYINSRKGNVITFMITADEHSKQRAGWKFASKEHQFLNGPMLVLDGKE